jgi:hypothetical protein
MINRTILTNVLSLGSLLLILILMGFNFHITSNPLVGDSASHTLQALSIAYDFDLKFEDRDREHWKSLNWKETTPRGLFFQSYRGGYAFAKPYGYSLFLAVFVYLFGNTGFVIGNVLIFGLINIFVFLTIRVLYGKLESILLTISFTFFSYAYMYVFYIHSDLFLTLLSSIFVFLFTRLFIQSSKLCFIALCLVTACIISEKPPAALALLPVLLFYFYKTRSVRTIISFGLILAAGILLFIFPYLHYSDYKSWNPYAGNRFYATTSKPFTFDGDKPPSSYHAKHTGHHFSITKTIKRIFDTSKFGEKATSFYYYFFGAYTGMIVFIPFAFIIIMLSIFRMMKKHDLQLIAPLTGLFFYILFYVMLFHENYYGGGQSLGNRYFLQISPLIILLVLGLNLKNKEVTVIFLISLGLSAMFLYRHHLKPKQAHIDIAKTGYIQEIMPFEKNQVAIPLYLSDTKMVNLNIFPSLPRGVKYDYIINLEDRRIAIQAGSPKHKNKFVDIANISDLFRETTLNDKIILLNTGFYQSEQTHVWSKKKSAILLRNNKKKEYFLINGYLPDTTVKVQIEGRERIGTTPFSLSIYTSKYQDKWILISFEADKSGIPSKIKNIRDNRELSFSISYKPDKVDY